MKRLALVFVVCSMIVTPSLLLADPPAESGPYVTRTVMDGFPLEPWLFHIDWDAQLLAVYGIDIVAWCSGGGELEPVSIQEITTPSVGDAIMQLVTADGMTASVWQGNSCAFILSNPPVATGEVDMISTDNDLLTFLNPDSNRFNAFGYSAHGFLTTPAGERVRLNSHSKCVWDGQDGVQQDRCHDKIVLR